MAALDRKKSQRRMKLLPAPSLLSVLLTITFTFLHQRPASAQTGFLSLDCGAPAPYVDERGISWEPDDAYISGGKKSPTTDTTLQLAGPLKNFRSFPDTTRNCYSLPTSPGQTYLVRAGFYHGKYDFTATTVQFDIALDVFATRETYTVGAGEDWFSEYVFRGFKDTVQFCLFRLLPSDTPFISYLELRPLDKTMYALVADGSALVLYNRQNWGPVSTLSPTIRYPEDPYDRYWLSAGGTGLIHLTSTSVVNTGFAVDKPPPAVMNTALTVVVTSLSTPSMWQDFSPAFRNNSYVVNLYLAELEPSLGLTRTFDVYLNGKTWLPTVNIYRNASNLLYTPVQYTTNDAKLNASGGLRIDFTRSASSSGPAPLVNAVEILSINNKLPATLADEVSAIEGLKKSFGLGPAWPGDPCLILPYDWLSCTASSPPRISTVNLSSAGLVGGIPDLRALSSLTTLHLDNNKLTGQIPDWLASLPVLRELHLQNNKLTGNVPKGLLTLPVLRLEGNPGLCWNTTCPEDKKINTVLIIVPVVVGVLVVVGILVVVVMCCRRRRRRRPRRSKPDTVNNPPIFELELEKGLESTVGIGNPGGESTRGSRYTLAQVMVATNNHAKMLGRGGFGPVYYGKLASGQEVAVKVSAKGSNQGSKEFMNEIILLTRVHHKNLVSLVGYCDEGDNLILLYEYMPRGTVQEHLYEVGNQTRKGNLVLDWKTRLQIALNSAQGLEYLHTGCNPVIFHRDVKSNNILLNEKMIAKVADFGLSKSTEEDNVTHMTTMVKGTIGYLDPEYYSSNQLSDKSDVYAFGIVLLEMICARPPFVPQLPKNQSRLDQWVRRHLEAGTMEEIVDRALVGQYNEDAMWKVVDLAMMSVEPKGKHRPSMCTVVQELRAAVDIENNVSSSFNRPSHHGSSSSATRFDIQQSSSSVSDNQITAPSLVQAR